MLDQTYPEWIVTHLEECRSQYMDKRSGCDLVPLSPCLLSKDLGSSHQGGVVATGGKQFLLPVITRMDFKHQQDNPDADASSNPSDAVLKGYVSRERDEAIVFLDERDFTASMMHEGNQRRRLIFTGGLQA